MTDAVTHIPTHFCPRKVVKRNFINIDIILFNVRDTAAPKLMHQFLVNIFVIQQFQMMPWPFLFCQITTSKLSLLA